MAASRCRLPSLILGNSSVTRNHRFGSNHPCLTPLSTLLYFFRSNPPPPPLSPWDNLFSAHQFGCHPGGVTAACFAIISDNILQPLFVRQVLTGISFPPIGRKNDILEYFKLNRWKDAVDAVDACRGASRPFEYFMMQLFLRSANVDSQR